MCRCVLSSRQPGRFGGSPPANLSPSITICHGYGKLLSNHYKRGSAWLPICKPQAIVTAPGISVPHRRLCLVFCTAAFRGSSTSLFPIPFSLLLAPNSRVCPMASNSPHLICGTSHTAYIGLCSSTLVTISWRFLTCGLPSLFPRMLSGKRTPLFHPAIGRVPLSSIIRACLLIILLTIPPQMASTILSVHCFAIGPPSKHL